MLNNKTNGDDDDDDDDDDFHCHHRKTSRHRQRRRLIWHRRDLRLHDNELYSNINDYYDGSTVVISLYVFDEHYFQPRPSCVNSSSSSSNNNNNNKIVWCGPHAAQATIEAVTCLRESLRSIGGELLVRIGDPTIIVPKIATEFKVNEIFFHEEPGTYERGIIETIKQRYHQQQQQHNQNKGDGDVVNLVSKVGYTLYHPNDLPFDPMEWDQLAHPKRKNQKNQKKKQKK